MEWQVIVALVIGIPIILFPAVYVWYIVIGGLIAARRVPREIREAEQKGSYTENLIPQNLDPEYEEALRDNLQRYLGNNPGGIG